MTDRSNIKEADAFKILLLTHTDLDGYSCRHIVEKIYSKENVTTIHADYNEVNTILDKIINTKKYLKYTKIMITDLSVNEDIAVKLDRLNSKEPITIELIDHHSTALWLDEFEWADVKVTQEDGKLTCATKMLADKYKKSIDYKISRYAESVRLYDTYEWKQDEKAYKGIYEMNKLFNMLGYEKFISEVEEYSYDINVMLFLKYSVTLQVEEVRYQRYLERKLKTLRGYVIMGRYVGVTFAEQDISRLGNDLSAMNPNYDLIAIVNGDTGVSLRTTKDNIHCGEFAKCFGGGGHAKSAGISFSNETIHEFLRCIFE